MALFNGTNAPTIVVEFDYGNRGLFTLGISPLGGTDVLGGSAALNWQPITITDVRRIAIRRGKSQENQAIQPGTCSITVDNFSGNYDPDNAASSFFWYGYSTLVRGMAVRVSAVWSSVTYVLFVGEIEDIATDVSLDPTVTFTAVDQLAGLANVSLSTIIAAYSGDTTAARIGRYLDLAEFPTSQRSLTGARTMQPTTLGSNVLALCEEAAACEYGRFFIDRNGNAKLIPYENLKTTTLQFALSDTRAANTVEYDTIVSTPGSKYLVNNAVLTQYSGHTQSASNATSILRFGATTPFAITAPLLLDADAVTMVGYYANRTALPLTRIDRVEFDAIGLTTQWPGILASDLGDRVSVARTTVDARSLSYTNLIESLNHDITPDNWRIGLDLSPSTF